MDLCDHFSVRGDYCVARWPRAFDRGIAFRLVAHDLGYRPLPDIPAIAHRAWPDGFFRGLLHSDSTGIHRYDPRG